MKILTPRNNIDYYDYLTGIYGEDEKVVYDRRAFTVLCNLDSPFFSVVSTLKEVIDNLNIQLKRARSLSMEGKVILWINSY